MLLQPQLDFIKGGMNVNLIFHPLNFKKPQQIFADKRVEVFSFPLKHSISTCGFLFREIQKQPNIKKEIIQEYKIPVSKIKEIKSGADFITEDGQLIPNEKLTTPPPHIRSYAFCSDTAFHPSIAEFVSGVDLLYHEATFLEAMRDFSNKTLHSTTIDAANTAKAANVKKLLIGHFSARYNDIKLFEREEQSVFENTEAAKEGKTYKII